MSKSVKTKMADAAELQWKYYNIQIYYMLMYICMHVTNCVYNSPTICLYNASCLHSQIRQTYTYTLMHLRVR